MRIGANFKKAFSAPYLKQYLLAGVGATVYTVLPTALKMQGWGAFGVGFGAAFLLGVALDSPGIIYGAVATAIIHLIYTHGTGVIEKTFNSSIWRLGGANAATSPNIGDGAWNATPYIADYVGPSQAPSYPSGEWSAPAVVDSGMADYQDNSGRVLSDGGGYVNTANQVLSDDDSSSLNTYGTFREGIADGGFAGDSFFGN